MRQLMPCTRDSCGATATVQLVRKKGTKWMCKTCHREWLQHIDKTLEEFVSGPAKDEAETDS